MQSHFANCKYSRQKIATFRHNKWKLFQLMEFNAGCIKNTSVDPNIVPTRSKAVHSAARSAVPHWNKDILQTIAAAATKPIRADLGSQNKNAI
jgi:hypothetical protein